MSHIGSFAASRAAPPERFSAQALWKLVRRRLWVVGVCAVAGFVTALGVSATLPKLYTASGAIAVGGESLTIPEMQGALRANDNDPMLLVRTEEQALAASQLIEKVVRQLKMADRKEFNPALITPGLVARTLNSMKSWLPSGDLPKQRASSDQAIVGAASKAMTVFNDNRSLVITVGFTSTDPTLSADFVNTLISNYQADRAHERNAADQAANAALSEQVTQINGEIVRLEAKVGELRDQGRLVTLRAGGVGQQELESLATQAVQARMARALLESTLAKVNAPGGAGTTSNYSVSLASETMSRLRDQEATAVRRVSDMTAHFGKDYPGLREAQANLASIRALLKQEDARNISSLVSQLQVARSQETEAQAQLDRARDQAVKTESLQAGVEAIERQIADRRSLVQQLQQRSQLTIAPISSRIPDVRELNRAEPPASPSSPKKGAAGVVGGLAGGMIGLLLVIGRVRSVGAVPPTAAGLPVFVVLRSRSVTGRKSLLDIVSGYPAGEEAEALRMLRTHIRVASHSVTPRIVAFISGHDGNDGARIAAAFAGTAARDGERTLLIEADLRAPALAVMLDIGDGRLPEVLNGEADWRDSLVRSSRGGFDVLAASSGSAGGHAMLNGVRFQNLLSEVCEDYNLVVLSAPTARARADALTVAHRADASVLIFNRRSIDQASSAAFAADLANVSPRPATALVLSAK